MQALEPAVKPLGVSRVNLNVCGDNSAAIHPRQTLGYQVLGIDTRKPT
jgi:hypothetical protein